MSKNLTLALDTTSSPLFICVENEGKVYSIKRAGIKQEELLFPALNKVLSKADGTLTDVKKVFFLRGPGRFTGIRIGLTLTAALRALNGAEAASMTMFEYLDYQARRTFLKDDPRTHAVVLHAFREEYFLQIFDGSAPLWLSKEELISKLKNYSAPLIISGFDKERTSLKPLLCGFDVSDGSLKILPKVFCAAAKETAFKQDSLEPLYLKPARFELCSK